MRESPTVDVIIPVHDPSRPIARAVGSLLRSGLEPGRELSITVVCHNIDESEISAVLPPPERAAVRLLGWRDGIPSPAGPFRHGIAMSSADYVSIMGSDDTLDDGALGEWLTRAEDEHLTAFIPAERHVSGARIRTPPVRPGRRRSLDALRDRLAYRTAPLGLIRREAVDRLGLTFPGHLRNGSDQLFGLKLWFSGEPIGYGRGAPEYVVGSDARDRVTMTVRPVDEELRAVVDLHRDNWFSGLPLRSRRAIAVKSVRVHVFAAVASRSVRGAWPEGDRARLAEVVATIRAAAPGFASVLSVADRRLLDAIAAPATPDAVVTRLSGARRRFGTPATVLPSHPRGLLARDGPLRFMVASALL